MIRVLMGGVVLLCLTAVLRSNDPKEKPKEPPTEAAKAYQGLLKEYGDAYQDFVKALRAAKTDEEKKQAQEKYPQPASYAKRFLEAATKYPSDPAAVDSLVWVATRAGGSKEAERALGLLVKNHIDDPKMAQVCQSMASSQGPEVEKFLKSVLEKSKDHNAQGQACFALGLLAKRVADKAKEKKEPDADKLSKEAEGKFEKVAADFADVKAFRGTLGEAATAELFEIRFLGVGMTAPDIEGEDIDGSKMKLSDFKGKVVLLDFWGNW